MSVVMKAMHEAKLEDLEGHHVGSKSSSSVENLDKGVTEWNGREQ